MGLSINVVAGPCIEGIFRQFKNASAVLLSTGQKEGRIVVVHQITLKDPQIELLQPCAEVQFIESGGREGFVTFDYDLDGDLYVEPLGQGGSTVTITGNGGENVSFNVQRCIVDRFSGAEIFQVRKIDATQAAITEDTFRSSISVKNPYDPKAWALYQEGLHLVGQGDLSGAEAKFQAATEKDEKIVPAWLEHGKIKLRTSAPGDAVKYFDAAVRAQYAYPDSYYFAALARSRISDPALIFDEWESAISGFKKYLMLSPDGIYSRDAGRRLFAMTREFVALCFQKAAAAGKNSEKMEYMFEALMADPFNPRALLYTAPLYEDFEPARAIEYYHLAGEFDPDSDRMRRLASGRLIDLAGKLGENKKYELAVKAYEAALSLEPDNVHLLKLALAMYEKLSDEARAKNYEKEALVLCQLAKLSASDREEAVVKLAVIASKFKDIKKYDVAIKMYRFAAALMPGKSEYFFKLAEAIVVSEGGDINDTNSIERMSPEAIREVRRAIQKCYLAGSFESRKTTAWMLAFSSRKETEPESKAADSEPAVQSEEQKREIEGLVKDADRLFSQRRIEAAEAAYQLVSQIDAGTEVHSYVCLRLSQLAWVRSLWYPFDAGLERRILLQSADYLRAVNIDVSDASSIRYKPLYTVIDEIVGSRTHKVTEAELNAAKRASEEAERKWRAGGMKGAQGSGLLPRLPRRRGR